MHQSRKYPRFLQHPPLRKTKSRRRAAPERNAPTALSACGGWAYHIRTIHEPQPHETLCHQQLPAPKRRRRRRAEEASTTRGRLGVEFQSSTAQALDRRAQRAPPANVRPGAPQAEVGLLWQATVAALRGAENSGSGDRVRSADQLRCVILRVRRLLRGCRWWACCRLPRYHT